MPTLKSKSPVKNSTLLTYFSLFLPFFLMMSCYGKKQIVIADSLQNNSTRWEAITKGGGLKIGKTKFGPYRTINSEKLDSAKLKTKSYSFWDLHFNASDETETKRKVYSLDIVRGNDTAKVLLYVKITNYLHFKGAFSILDEDTSQEIQEAKGKIVINSSKEPWEFLVYPYGVASFRSSNIYGLLWSQNDTINVKPVSTLLNLNEGRHLSAQSKGLVLEEKGKTIAAIQLLGKNYIWINRDIPKETQLVIAGLFSTILSSKNL